MFKAISLVLALASLQLGAAPIRENIEWLDVWVPDTSVTNLPRVLLIGDSITRAYYPFVEESLKGKAVVARLATSKCAGDPALTQEVALLLRQYHFDVVHFNNGMHGWGYTEQQYAAGISALVKVLRKEAPRAKLIWAATTPVRQANHLDRLDAKTDRVKVRNKMAGEIMAKRKIPADDLFSLVADHPEYYKPDGIHSNEAGEKAEARQVAEAVTKLLP